MAVVKVVLPDEIERRFSAYCARACVTKSSVLRSAILSLVQQEVSKEEEGTLPLSLVPVRDGSVSVRLSSGEKKALVERMLSEGFTLLSTWCRSVLLSVSSKKPSMNEEELFVLREGHTQIRKLGVNVNQIAHRLHADEDVDGEETLSVLSDVRSSVKAYHGSFVQFTEACRKRW